MGKEYQFINKTKEVWQPHYNKKLSSQDLQEMTHNMMSLFDLIASWDKAFELSNSQNSKESNDEKI